MRLGVLGGTFDPVHIGHLILGEFAREQLSLGRVLFVPAGQPWRKEGREITGAEHRVAMLRLAAAGNPAFEVSTIEIEREGPSYTVDTLRELRAANPEAEIFLIVGLDAYEDMPNWHDVTNIVHLAWIGLAGRMTLPLGSKDPERRIPGLREKIEVIENDMIEVSATDIRERSRTGRSIRYLVPEAVEVYIREHGLYR